MEPYLVPKDWLVAVALSGVGMGLILPFVQRDDWIGWIALSIVSILATAIFVFACICWYLRLSVASSHQDSKSHTAMKIVGSFALLAGLLLMIFTGLAYSEFRKVATAMTPPAPDSLPLTKIICPELFESSGTAMKPSELASIAMKRIYIMGGVSLLSLTLGALLLVARPSSTSRGDQQGEPTAN